MRMAADKLDCWKLKANMAYFSYVHGIMNGEIEKHKSAYEANAKYIIR